MSEATESRNARCIALGILALVIAGPLSSQRLVPDDARECKRPHVLPFTSVNLPKLQKLFPLARLERAYQLVLVVESPVYLQRRMFGALSLGAFDSTGRLDVMGQAGFKLDLDQLRLKVDSVPQASIDSTLLSARAMVNQRRQTMTIALGETDVEGFQSPLLLLFVTDVRNGITGMWLSRGGSDPDAPRGFFCAFPK